ncbi:AraC-like DNA-binding protein [Povalibacter uvarum]|uniref:AraC-like DNA-binding protein n=1 Tax=Povalibacter uvarum TaxID=732238 RepID=A0A841HRY3_9GAMM|nr:helix-turn-helix domain-containing protein [Povalibacter uvarum]MBB6096121.1 AraC-like DNA-binding protein [Povalibacter uvarum]
MALNWFVSLLRILHCVILGKDTGLGLVFAFMEVGVTLWAIFSLLQPTTDAMQLPAIARIDTTQAAAKYGRSALDATARARIQRKLSAAMTDLRLHRDSALSLRALCDHIRENPHYVSQVLNQDLATSFHDFVNRQRIDDAKVALRSSPERPILEIALDVGFNSKSTFNAAFRAHAGMTPSEYRRPQAASPLP